VHTGGVGRWLHAELIHEAADLSRWLEILLDHPLIRSRAADVASAKRLREAIWRMAERQVAAKPTLAEDVEVVNAAARKPSTVVQLGRDGTITKSAEAAQAALSTVARDAVDLFGGPFRSRVRACAAPDCDLLLVDMSRPGHRRWCSMYRCGTRAKMRQYRSRKSGDS
jgi:predicted RNA-binding Zn ribbon-like protein